MRPIASIGLASTVPGDSVTITNYTYRYDNADQPHRRHRSRRLARHLDATTAPINLSASSGPTPAARRRLTYNTTYTYDPVGNRLVKWDSGALTTSTYDVANQLQTSVASTGVTTYTFDLTGNQQIVSAPTGITTTTWDNENRQTHVTRPAGTANSCNYNADGQRFLRKNSSGTTLFVWDVQALLGLGGSSSGAADRGQLPCSAGAGDFWRTDQRDVDERWNTDILRLRRSRIDGRRVADRQYRGQSRL